MSTECIFRVEDGKDEKENGMIAVIITISLVVTQNLPPDHLLKCFVKSFMPVQCLKKQKKSKPKQKWFEVVLFAPADVG